MRTVNSLIGSPIERLEDLRFLRGRGQYVDDLARRDMLHAAILRSSVAHGRIRSIDVTRARALPGVHTVITAKEIGNRVPRVPMRLQPLPEFERFGQPVIAETKVRYVGEAIAVVLAGTPGIAEDALGLIETDIEVLPAVANRRASADNQSLLFEEAGTNLAMRFHAVRGDAAAAFAGAPYVRRESFRTQRHMALPLEPRGLLAEWDAALGRLTIYGGAKVLFFNRRTLAKQFGLAEAAVEIVENDVGGGFGARGEFYPEDFLIPFASRLTGRPVKWTEDRRENLMCINHAREAECEVEIACTRDGTILGLRGHAYVDVGAYMRTNGAVGARNVAQFMSGPYRIPNIDIDVALQLTNKTPVGTYRGPGRFETDFFRERLLDMVAQDLGLDRVAFRRRNLVSKQEMPYQIATITPFESKDEFDSGDYQATLDRCLDEIKWSEKSKLAGKLVDGRYHGLALGCFIEGGAAGPKESARIVLERDGLYSVYVGSSAIGQGLETAFAQIAADALEVTIDRIRGVFHGSTSYVGDGYGAYHSRSVVMGGSAILDAAAKLRDAIRVHAAQRLNCQASAVEIVDGLKVVGRDGSSVALNELSGESISAEGAFLNKKHTYTYGAHAAHVAVDPKLGHVELLDYVVVADCGRIINPLTVHGQTVGSVVQGLGGAMMEHLVYDQEGQLLTGSLADYLIPTASDFPNIRAVMLEQHPSPINPLGAKGAGEGGIIAAGGVMANAVANALSSLQVQPRELPLTPTRIWELVQAGRS
ncbi:MAG TPA: xanthine dehydrogenase family protein molybdopterin-binding subunit [Xanthobacteraceae bacterium]|jgi:aerobic carbon-monoxide dehydrogenase large subunit|nr:xanthine dehydrogenase family protein molybdopterin-binding subunit [Xanthobacteraceae bacterium]